VLHTSKSVRQFVGLYMFIVVI